MSDSSCQTKIVCFQERYVGYKRRVKREVVPIYSIQSFILDKVKDVIFTEDECLVSHSSEQIRIPAKEFEKLMPEVQRALRKECIPNETYHHHTPPESERWLNENYWTKCDAYIFRFRTHKIQIGLHWGYDGLEDADLKYEFAEFEHPIIGDLISCYEMRWGEAGEDKSIIKYYYSSHTTVITEKEGNI